MPSTEMLSVRQESIFRPASSYPKLLQVHCSLEATFDLAQLR
jgi:hypothetical protein